MIKSESIAKLADALSKAQKEMKNAIKDSSNPFFKSNYADLASVREACQGPLSDHGLAVIQLPETDSEGKPCVTSVLLHSSGEWIAGTLTMNPVKADPQGIGSAITYARRYQLAAITGIATEDDDGNAASGNSEPKRAAEPRTFGNKVSESVGLPLVKEPPSNNADPCTVADSGLTEELKMSIEYISAGQAANLHKQFRKEVEQYHPAKALESDDFLGEWLKQRGYVDKDGKRGTASRIPASGWFKVRDQALEYAKTLTGK